MISTKKNVVKEPRNTKTIIKLGNFAIKTEWTNTVIGEFPITEWRTFPIEVPSKKFKCNILGRSLEGEASEVIHLPMYIGEDICDAKIFEDALIDPIRAKEVANIPALTIATKSCGNYSNTSGPITQSLAVLPLWADGTAMVLELDWFEYAEENNNTPEWYIKASDKLSVSEGFKKIKECTNAYPLVNPCYYLYINPITLGNHILGEGKACPNKFWLKEWTYYKNESILEALDLLFKTINLADISILANKQ